MAVSRFNEDDLRTTRKWLVWAFVISALTHVVVFFALLMAVALGLLKFDSSKFGVVLATPKSAEVKKQEAVKQLLAEQQEIPLNFIEVDPAAVTAEPPKNAKYYSSKNSHAANKEADLNSNIPKIDGKQTHVARTETAPRSKAVPLQPSPPKTQSPQSEVQEAKAAPKGGPKLGDLAMAKPDSRPDSKSVENDTGEAAVPVHKRPRTLNEAMAQHLLAGEKMKQEGGVSRHLSFNSMDTKKTSFGEYDRELIEAIQNEWYKLLDEKNYSRDGTGKVVIEFRLDYKGNITNLRIVHSEVQELLTDVCELAIRDPIPYAPWPSDMRRLMNADYREIQFTFFYE